MLNSKSNVRNIGDILGKDPSSFTFQDPPKIAAPFTQITDLNGNSRQIPDPSKTIKPAMGIERINCRILKAVPKERGPNGELVTQISSEDQRIRFVGSWTNVSTASGTYLATSVVSNYVEVTFYGTGLNLLTYYDTNNSDYRASVDGGAEGANFFPTGKSVILANRNYNANGVFPVVSGLALGTHTVKIRLASIILIVQGFEILNSSSQIKIPAGEVFANGLKYTNPSLQSIDYNTGFDGNPALYGRGGRVVEYITPQGRIGKVIQQTNAAQANLSSADHTNEDVIRRINWREFGANGADDFSTLSGGASSRAFTLDDGTTTLVGNNARTTGVTVGFITDSVGGFATITFVGTGLDVYLGTGNGTTTDTINVLVDGASIGNMPTTNNQQVLVKVVSGLPYGTHTVKFNRTVASVGVISYEDFIIYGPKKPSIPANAQELSEYYLMSDFSSVLTLSRPSQGTLFKTSVREHVYTGTWEAVQIDINDFGGQSVRNNTGTGETLSLTFFGTGVEIWGRGGSSGATLTVNIDGAAYTGSASVIAGSWTPGTSTWVTSTSNGEKLLITGLSLGLHTVRLTNTVNPGQFAFQGMSVVTPIHYPDTKVGSLSMGPSVQLKAAAEVAGVDLSKAKAWLQYDNVNGTIVSSYNVSAVLSIGTGNIKVYWEKIFKNEPSIVVGGSSTATVQVLGVDTSVFNGTKKHGVNLQGIASINMFHLVVYGELADEGDE
jgi:hypothetical protein